MKIFKKTVIAAMLAASCTIVSAEIRVTTDEALKAVVKKIAPEYPAMARQMRVSGRVEVEVVIDPQGNVESVKVLSGNAMLTQSVVNTVKQWKFTPFTQGGTPAKAVAALDFDFKL